VSPNAPYSADNVASLIERIGPAESLNAINTTHTLITNQAFEIFAAITASGRFSGWDTIQHAKFSIDAALCFHEVALERITAQFQLARDQIERVLDAEVLGDE
jgi:hypothetical protein